MPKCPQCSSYGVYAIRRRWWQRWLRTPHRYHCQDCSDVFLRKELHTGCCS